MRFNARKLCALSAAAVVVGSLGALPSTAGAAFGGSYDTACETVDNLLGRGASFQNDAQSAWGAIVGARNPTDGFGWDAFGSGQCNVFQVPGTRTVTYEPLGSGAGLAAFGASAANSRHTDSTTGGRLAAPRNYGGTDDPPTAAQIDNANRGDGSDTFDDTSLHTIPVAQSAITVSVRIPDGCTVANTPAARSLSLTEVERAFAGDTSYDQWGELLTISGTGCSAIRFERVVRFDRSGTTLQFKRYLNAINAAPGWLTLANTAWPAGGRAAINAGRNGVGPQLDLAASQSANGAIAYGDLSSARSREFGWTTNATDRTASPNDQNDVRFWVYLERVSDRASRSPAVSNAQAGTRGANCGVTYNNIPASTTVTWENVDATATSAAYGVCVLTYALAWQDPTFVNLGWNGRGGSNATPFSQDQTRATKDYLLYVTDERCGQAILSANDYAPLTGGDGNNGTAPTAGSVLARARTGVQGLTWNGSPPGDTIATC